MAMAMHTPFYMHALLASCAAEYPAYDRGARDYFSRLSAKHYVHAITGLREALSGVNSARHSITIASTVLILCIFEVGAAHARSATSFGSSTNFTCDAWIAIQARAI
jgi:hypothetical protein